ncbi:hypothetical protein D3C72_582600 [compost metagenome]
MTVGPAAAGTAASSCGATGATAAVGTTGTASTGAWVVGRGAVGWAQPTSANKLRETAVTRLMLSGWNTGTSWRPGG